MITTLLRGTVVAGAVALAAAIPATLGLPSVWPVLLVAAIAFSRQVRPGAVASLLVGAAAWWLSMALRAGVLPDATSSDVLAAVLVVVIVTVVAAASRDRLPLFAGVGGAAAFAGIYEPVFADAPTAFLSDSPLAFGSVVVAVGLGVLAAVVADALASARSTADSSLGMTTSEGTL